MLHDLVYSFRSLRKSPGFSFLVIIALALGIGVNSAVFTIVHRVLIESIDYPDSTRLWKLFETKTQNDLATITQVAPRNFLDWRDQNQTFQSIAAGCGFHYNLTGSGAPEHVDGYAVSANWFDVLRVRPLRGRSFFREEDAPSGAPVVLISEALWKRRYQSDESIVGKAIGINGDSFTVVGVMPNGEWHPEMQLWIPLQRQIRADRMQSRGGRYLDVIGRPKPGVTLQQANQDLGRIAAAIYQSQSGGDIFAGAAVLTLQHAMTGDSRGTLLVCLGTAGLVLLVACANIAGLMLVRITGRTREFGIRMALGAGAPRLLRQLAIEGTILGVSAGLLGLTFNAIGKSLLVNILPGELSLRSYSALNVPVLLFTFLLSLLAGLFFALLPGLAVVRPEMHAALTRSSATITTSSGGRRMQHALIVAEVACSLVLLAGAGLLMRSFAALREVPLGFSTEHRVAVGIALPRIRYQSDSDVARFFQQVGDKVRALPGVEDATVGYPLPLTGNSFGTSFRKSDSAANADQYNDASLRLIDSRYFPVLSIPMQRGRNFTDDDTIAREPVCIVNLAMARKFWPGEDPIGHSLIVTRGDVAGEQRPRRIVGVVSDVRDELEEQEPWPTLYVPYAQMSFFHTAVVVRTRDSVAATSKAVAAALKSVDPDQPILNVEDLNQSLPIALGPWRSAIDLLGGLAALAIGLTGLGVFAVISYLVRQKTREIGIRIAVGATSAHIRNLVLGQALRLVSLGAVLGIALSVATTRLLSDWVYGVSYTDPLTFACAVAGLAVVSLVASYLPARRATRVDPLIALRSD
jgi:putative ABC transport system permease protein